MSTLSFTKMQGLGNDFIVIDAFSKKINLSTNQIRHLANRHFGIGADQILLIEQPIKKNADFRYRIFNADGNEVEHCGNGARCFTKYVRDQKLTNKDKILVEVNETVTTMAYNSNNSITVEMGIPNFNPISLPFLAESLTSRIENNCKIWQTRTNQGESLLIEFSTVSIGNPHAVLIVENIETTPVSKIAKFLENGNFFPNGVNVGFSQILDRHSIKLRVHERGVGETLACGTGACAAAVTGIQRGRLDSPVKVLMSGGELSVAWENNSLKPTPILMTGPAVTVFTGQIELNSLVNNTACNPLLSD